MLEMIYTKNRKQTILDKGNYNEFNYVIVSYGTHPCCYVELPKGNKYYNQDYDDINISCHGGLTFADNRDFGNGEKFYIGWDYAHYNDYTSYFDGKKWTTKELLKEVKEVINQLVESEVKSGENFN